MLAPPYSFLKSAATVFSGGVTGGLLEDRGEIVFVGKTAKRGDDLVRLCGLGEKATGSFYSKFFYVIADRRSRIAVEKLVYGNAGIAENIGEL